MGIIRKLWLKLIEERVLVRTEYINGVSRLEYIQEHQLLEYLQDPDEEVRAKWASIKFRALDPKLVEQGLQDPYWRVRLGFIPKWEHDSHPMEWAIKGLDDTYPIIRKAWAERLLEHYDLKKELIPYIPKGINDPKVEVAEIWIRRCDTFTPEQIEKGLQHPRPDIRVLWGMKEFTPTCAQVERGLTDESDSVRRVWSKRCDYTPTYAQVERGLTDESDTVRWIWSKRCDYTPTPEQVQRGLTDPHENIRKIWEEKAEQSIQNINNELDADALEPSI